MSISPAENRPGPPGPFPPAGPEQWQYQFIPGSTPALPRTATPGGQANYANLPFHPH